jgi:predicted nucleic acid-binding protein
LRGPGLADNIHLGASRQLLLDTNCFIYFLGGTQPYLDLLRPVFRRVQRGELAVFVSAMTEAELLVRAYRNRDEAAVERVRDLLSEDGFYVVSADRRIAVHGARIRGEYMRGGGDRKMAIPDAIIIATAIETGCDAIVGNDAAWRGRTEIPFVYLKEAVTNQ